MTSKTQMCNLALTQIGAHRIISLDDGTEEATLCNTLFDDISDEVIALGPWTSCVFRAQLAPTTTTPSFEFSYQFQLPEDPYCLRVLNLYNHTGVYKVEGRKILSNESPIELRYIGRPADPSAYDQMLKATVVARLRMELAYVISGQTSIVQAAEDKYRQTLIHGLGVDGKQGTSETFEDNPLITARR